MSIYGCFRGGLPHRGRPPQVYACGGWYSGDNSAEQGYDLYPHGLCERLVRKGTALPFADWVAASEAALPRYRLPPVAQYDDTTWEYNVLVESFKANHTRAFHALMHGMSKPGIPMAEKRQAFAVAMEGYRQVVAHPQQLTPTPDYLLKNLGIAYTQAGQVEPSAKQVEYQREGVAWFRRYMQVAKKDDKDLPNIAQYLQQIDAQARV
jgi:hypothetical protein